MLLFDIEVHHLHHILSQRTCLVGKDHIHRTDSLAGVHLLYQIILLGHSLHRECQSQSHRQWQTLWHRYDNHHHSTHQELHLGHQRLQRPSEWRITKGKIPMHEVEYHKHQTRNAECHLVDHCGQLREFDLQWSLVVGLLRSLTCGLTDLGLITHLDDDTLAHTLLHVCAAQQKVWGKARTRIRLIYRMLIHRYRLTRHGSLGNLHIGSRI